MIFRLYDDATAGSQIEFIIQQSDRNRRNSGEKQENFPKTFSTFDVYREFAQRKKGGC